MGDTRVARLLEDKQEELGAAFRRFDGEVKSLLRCFTEAIAKGAEGFTQFDERTARDRFERACRALRDGRPLAEEVCQLKQMML